MRYYILKRGSFLLFTVGKPWGSGFFLQLIHPILSFILFWLHKSLFIQVFLHQLPSLIVNYLPSKGLMVHFCIYGPCGLLWDIQKWEEFESMKQTILLGNYLVILYIYIRDNKIVWIQYRFDSLKQKYQHYILAS